MCQGYTFCQQSQRKLYSVSYKTVISCFANIPIHPSLWCDSTVEKQNRHKLKTQPSSFPSCREPWGILNCDPPAWDCQQGNPPISQDLLEARPGAGEEELRADHRTSSSPGDAFLWAASWAPKMPSFPNTSLFLSGVCILSQGVTEHLWAVTFFKLLLLPLARATRF